MKDMEWITYCVSLFSVIFVLYEALPEPSVKKMEHVVDTAMDIVLLLSFTVRCKNSSTAVHNNLLLFFNSFLYFHRSDSQVM
jgi:hypothetical protein